jgi:hypothetical protein
VAGWRVQRGRSREGSRERGTPSWRAFCLGCDLREVGAVGGID